MSTPRYLDLPTAADLYCVSQTSLRRLVDQGALTPYRPLPNKTWLSTDELDQLFAAAANAPQGDRGRHLRRDGQQGRDDG